MVKLPFKYEEFKSIYSRVPRLCIDLAITSPGGILLAKRNLSSWKGQWYMPGGTVYYKETLEQAAKRVAKDELNVEIEVDRELGHIEYLSEEKERGFGWSISIVLQCHIIEGLPQTTEQGSDPRFFNLLPTPVIEEQKGFLIRNKELFKLSA